MLYDEIKSLSGAFKTIPGFGSMVSSAYFNEVGNENNYQRGSDVSSSIGIVPRQRSSGGKDTLLGVNKRGSSYLRCLLIQEVKAVVSRANMFLQTVVTK
jgi:transposase